MSKRLILILALALVIGIGTYAFAEVQNVKVGGDVTALGLMREARVDNSQGGTASDDKDQSLLSIVRLRVDADLTDNVTATLRLINDRYWGSNDRGSANSDIDLDLAYLTLKEFLYSPLTLAVGAQELRFGNAMIVGDPTTNNIASGDSNLTTDPDLDMRKAFDAIRATLNYNPLVIDIVAAKVEEDVANIADDVNLYGVNANYALNKTTNVEGYYWLKHYGRKKDATVPKGQKTNVVGGRLVTQPIDNLTYQLEAAYQFGTYHNESIAARPTVDRRAWGLETALTYNMPNLQFSPSVTAGYGYFRGEKDNYTEDAGKYRGWDPMFEDQTFGSIANALVDQTNVHLILLNGSIKPLDDVALQGEYYAYWWDKPYTNGAGITTRRGNSATMTDKRFAGQEIDLTATYNYTEDVQFSLMTGVFLPGKSFDKTTDNTASQVIGSMKVTF